EAISPLMAAIRDRREWALDMLLDAGANPNRIDPARHAAPLAEAVRTGQKSAAEILIARGADVNMLLPDGLTLLQGAIRDGAEDGLIGLLLDKGANPDAAGDIGTALHAAVRHKRPAALNLLLQHNADPLHPDAAGATPLQAAISLLGREHPIVDRLNIADGAARIALEQAARQRPRPDMPDIGL